MVNQKLVAKGEVVVIEESFGIRITEIIKDPDQLAQMAKNAERIAIPNVEDRIYEEIRKVVIKKVTG